jgi:hypothetical protein
VDAAFPVPEYAVAAVFLSKYPPFAGALAVSLVESVPFTADVLGNGGHLIGRYVRTAIAAAAVSAHPALKNVFRIHGALFTLFVSGFRFQVSGSW